MLQSWLTLYHSRTLGSGDWQRALSTFGTADAVLSAPLSGLRAIGLDRESAQQLLQAGQADSPVRKQVDEDLAWQEAADNHHIVALPDADYPESLKQIANPPPVLYLRGQRCCLGDRQVALVGSRKASPYGREQAFSLARELAGRGITVTSGLAEGIDACAHRGALHAGGSTVAVLGNGIDVCFPGVNRELYEDIAATGLLISEFARGTPPKARQFPQRNRIISGLSLGVVVVEGTVRSGSLITARLAMEQNREVFAVPGSVRNPQSRGCHQLLREGAALAEQAGDVLETLELDGGPSPTADLFRVKAPPVLPAALQAVLDQIDDDPVPIDHLVQRTGLTLAELSRHLLQLEIRGRISRDASGYRRQSVSGG
ncbi:MAG: DNA-processing protein DprA [Pseudomonadota bacterium]